MAAFHPNLPLGEWLLSTHCGHKQMAYIADRDIPAGPCFGLDRELPWKRKALLT
jgi:hypothetical protein